MNCPICGKETNNGYCADCGAWASGQQSAHEAAPGQPAPQYIPPVQAVRTPIRSQNNRKARLVATLLVVAFAIAFLVLAYVNRDEHNPRVEVSGAVQTLAVSGGIDENELLMPFLTDPDSIVGEKVQVPGQVGDLFEDNGKRFAVLWYDIGENYYDIMVELPLGITLKKDQYVLVSGTCLGKMEDSEEEGYYSVMKAVSSEKADYSKVVAPAAAQLEPKDAVAEQQRVTIEITKIEFAQQQTRVFVTIKNSSSSEIYLHERDFKLEQEGAAVLTGSAAPKGVGFPTWSYPLKKGSTTKSVAIFGAVDPQKPFTLTANGISSSDDVDLEPFVFQFSMK